MWITVICRGFRGFIMVGRDAASKKTPGISGISNSEPRAELALEVEVEGKDRCVRLKESCNPTNTMRLIIFSQPSVFIRGHLHAQLATFSFFRADASYRTLQFFVANQSSFFFIKY